MKIPALKRAVSVALAGLAVVAVAAPAPAQTLAANPWLERRILNISHQGGEIEAPSNTLYALKTSVAKGADVLEIDVHATADREIVVIHDATVDRTTNGTGRVDSMTLAQIKELDAAHWFVPGCGTCHDEPDSAYTLRGFATEARRWKGPKRERFVANDFKIPTLREVLETFPDELINIEIKATAPDTEPYEEELAALLAEFGRTDDTIVVAFNDAAVERFKLAAPDVHTATGTGQAALFWASSQGPLPGAPNPRHMALQVPIELEGVTVVTPEFVERAHANGLAVHVWTINDREEMEWLIEIGVDGIMTDRPSLLEEIPVATGTGI
ncbi:MAG TPA: glycerophosphodiester phosphodiesterase [Actinomycetota bacterium]|nr:glycerophosphodiester phosphodiesterase [Actinomycetota bacterium]